MTGLTKLTLARDKYRNCVELKLLHLSLGGVIEQKDSKVEGMNEKVDGGGHQGRTEVVWVV